MNSIFSLLDAVQPQVIINYAPRRSRAASWKNSWRFFEANAMALARLAEELQSRNYLERFIHIGISELYGQSRRQGR